MANVNSTRPEIAAQMDDSRKRLVVLLGATTNDADAHEDMARENGREVWLNT